MAEIIAIVLALVINHFFKEKVKKIVEELLPFVLLSLFILGIIKMII